MDTIIDRTSIVRENESRVLLEVPRKNGPKLEQHGVVLVREGSNLLWYRYRQNDKTYEDAIPADDILNVYTSEDDPQS